MSDSNPFLLLQHAFSAMVDSDYSRAGAVTFVVCDIISHFPEEVKHIWQKKWTPIKVLYIIARYYTLLFLV
ncbi:hypothetical protein CC1G_15667 [Coprinopsis cinerea okayama7|uniref:DUF6533 domain-containing protein n=1 Tax=Coprinopsis cinerea (strain Okayama-7 / 130 / ATCC MYA-4618 / FGSC 9003) TaxID=240176 RepID=D6RQC7_COPC7|nr:hypothetical protein CC1G_15667 [Coprinopsis cinerea okayama7\|eukprot:XP_002910237.1 hypothetical protein CC1G_15667 [Coprinopsis cinerea okayama7\